MDPQRIGNGYHSLSVRGDGRVNLRFLKDGTVLCEQAYLSSCGLAATPGRYRVELDTTQTVRPLSSASKPAWEFNARLDTPETVEHPEGETLPAVDVRYDVALGLDNTVAAGSTYAIKLQPGYQPGYEGSSRAWVSADDGATWTDLGSRPTDGGKPASFTAKAPRDGYVTLRVQATDGAGNLIDQTITRAWAVNR